MVASRGLAPSGMGGNGTAMPRPAMYSRIAVIDDNLNDKGADLLVRKTLIAHELPVTE